MTKKQDVLVQAQEFRATTRGPKAKSAGSVDRELQYTAMEEGTPLVVVKSLPLKMRGKVYHTGDQVILGEGNYDRSLVDQGWFCTPEAWEKGRKHKARKDYYNEMLLPLQLKVTHLRSNLNAANAEVSRIEAALKDAKNNAEKLSNNLRQVEGELLEALESASI